MWTERPLARRIPARRPRFENLVLSLPWLSQYAQAHPDVPFRLSYVHDSSFSDLDMKLFSADMRAIGRDNLISEVERMKDRLALLSVKGSDWLIFLFRFSVKWSVGALG